MPSPLLAHPGVAHVENTLLLCLAGPLKCCIRRLAACVLALRLPPQTFLPPRLGNCPTLSTIPYSNTTRQVQQSKARKSNWTTLDRLGQLVPSNAFPSLFIVTGQQQLISRRM